MEGRCQTRYLSRIASCATRRRIHFSRQTRLILFFLLIGLIDDSVAASTQDGTILIAVTESAKIDFQHVDGRCGRRYFLETVGSGIAFFDYDADGFLDIYFVNGADLPGFTSNTPANQ